MKSKILKILGVVLTVALISGIALTPVTADVTTPAVTVTPDDISANGEYVILFQVTDPIPNDGTGTITVEFPSDTDVPGSFNDSDISVQSTAGFGTANADTGILGADVTEDDNAVTIDIDVLPNPIGEFAQVKVTFTQAGDVYNPDDPGDYTLTVKTSEETTAVESDVYEIEAPDVGDLPGIIQVYNPSGILMSQYTGVDALEQALDNAGEDFTIRIGPGLYTEDEAFDWEGLTVEATGAAEDTIIKGATEIDGYEDITVSGLTFKPGTAEDWALWIDDTDDLVIENCIFEKSSKTIDNMLIVIESAEWDSASGDVDIMDCIFDTTYGTADDDVGIAVGGSSYNTAVDILRCDFMVDEEDHGVGTVGSCDIEDCTFTGASGIGVGVGGDAPDIERCTFDGLEHAITIEWWDNDPSVDIFGCEIMNSTDEAIVVDSANRVYIMGCNIHDNEDDVLLNEENSDDDVVMIFNNITDNENDVDNNGGDVIAIKNWWGDMDPDPDNSGDVDETPFLGAPITAAKMEPWDGSFDAKSAVGIKVEGDDWDSDPDFVAVSQFESNPGTTPMNPPLADSFFDICVFNGDACEDTMNTVRVYGDVTEQTEILVFTELAGTWVPASNQGVNAFSGYAWFKVTEDSTPNTEELDGMPLVLVTTPPTPVTIDLATPVGGMKTAQSNVPFTWGGVSGTEKYEFVLSANADLSSPLVTTSSTSTVYTYAGTLGDGTPYYWQVKAIKGDFVIGMSDVNAFIAAAPVVEEPPVINVEAPEAPIVNIEAPVATTPSYIWIIIGIGAILVIAVLILIVRTRRAV